MQSKICVKCGVDRPLDEFTRAKPSMNFSESHKTHHTYCKQCNAAYAREWRKAHPAYRGSGTISKVPVEDRLLMSAIRQRLTDAKVRCKKLRKPSPTVTADYLYELYKKQERKCALSGVILNLEKAHPLCLSLDQIDPNLGYVHDNVQWLAWCINRAKGDLSLNDFYSMCETILHQKVQRLSKSSES
ncbi:endonuclease [Achromobacter phage JWAlpha]|uniref:Uncharacterized protein n=1 Tax=Achromobacter phage JWAlpha TaxID=1416009 RepID=V9VEF5_9CAUD|nr:endonuclease [Achromobacter phage JWAlpha]AHC93969.1 hypothetical protein JJJB_0016 [Achromobacter phage JWAlpha]